MLIGVLVRDLLLQFAAHAALLSHMAGLALLTLVVLAQLTITVAMFQMLLPGLPAIRAARAAKSKDENGEHERSWTIPKLVSVALLPFFAYYAAWGFLGNTVRQYSRAVLDIAPFGVGVGNVLDVLDSRWIAVSVALSWAFRRLAKARQARVGANSFWQIIVVVCETNWIFIGLYVVARWKDQFLSWLINQSFLSHFHVTANEALRVVSPAYAATARPVETTPVDTLPMITNLFFFMLLPVVWLVLTALVYGYDVRDEKQLASASSWFGRIGLRYQSAPKLVRDFIAHFIGGYRSRYVPVANGVRIVLSAGVVLVAVLIVGFRLIDWLTAWAWFGATRLLGPHDPETWQVLAQAISLLLGSAYQDSSLGILVEPIRVCFLASVLEAAFSMSTRNPSDNSEVG